MGTPGPAQECGLETLLTPDQDSLETIIDVVAVHGLLSGGRKRTWFPDPDNPQSRLHDWFGSEWYAKTRFSVYGYSSTALEENAFTRHAFRCEAIQLLDALLHLAKGEATRRRGIVFFAHDIGATIIKEALNIAIFGQAKYEPIYLDTLGFVFFGCPHRYEAAERLQDSFIRLFHLAKSPAYLPDVAAGLARVVSDVNDDFSSTKLPFWTRSIGIFSTVDDINQQVFNKHEATLPYRPGLNFVQLECNQPHSELTNSTNNSIRLMDHITPILRLSSFVRQQLALSPPHITPHQSPYETLALREGDSNQDTLFSQKLFQEWASNSLRRILWVHDPDDPARTAASIALHLSPDSPKREAFDDHIVFCFEFRDWDQRQSLVTSMLCTFLATIIHSTPTTFSELSSWVKYHSSWSVENLLFRAQRALQIISCAHGWPVTWVLTNFPKIPDEFIYLMEQLKPMILLGSDFNLRVVVVSEDWPPSHFDALLLETISVTNLGHSGSKPSITVSIPDGPQSIERKEPGTADDTSPTGIDARPRLLHDELARLLVEWPQLSSMRPLLHRTFTECRTDKELRGVLEDWIRSRVIDTSPSGLESMIERLSPVSHQTVFEQLFLPTLLTLEAGTQSRRAVELFLCAARPLTIHEVESINAFLRKYNHSAILDLWSLRQGSRSPILSGLIRIRHGELHFAHRSFRDLLTRQFLTAEGLRSAHRHIVTLCVEYLLSSDTSDLITSYMDKKVVAESRLDFLFYAAKYWLEHVRIAGAEDMGYCPPIQQILRDKTTLDRLGRLYWSQSNPNTRPSQPSLLAAMADHGLDDMLFSTIEAHRELPSFHGDCLAGLEAAAQHSPLQVVNKLMDIPLPDGNTLQHAMLRSLNRKDRGEIVRIMKKALERRADFGKINAVLATAAFLNMVDVVKLLVTTSPEAVNQEVLLAATHGNSLASAKIVFGVGVKDEHETFRGSIVHYALWCGSKEVASLLLTANPPAFFGQITGTVVVQEPEKSTKDDNTPAPRKGETGASSDLIEELRLAFESAVNSHLPDMVELFVNKLPEWDDESYSEVLISALPGFLTGVGTLCFQRLLSSADRLVPRERLETIIKSQYIHAASVCKLATFRQLPIAGGPSPDNWGDVWRAVVERGESQMDLVRYVADEGRKIWSEEENRRQLGIGIETAAPSGCQKMVAYLIEKGADVDSRVLNPSTALYGATVNGHTGVMRQLIQAGADVNSKNWDGDWLPIHAACVSPPEKGALQAIIDSGADINLKSGDGRTALFYTIQFNLPDLAKILLSADSKPALDGVQQMQTEISMAVLNEQKEILQLLLEAGADPNRYPPNELEDPPLHKAVANGNLDILRLLLAYNTRVDTKTSTGDTALGWVTDKTPVSMVKLLVGRGLSIHTVDKDNYTPLWNAVKVGNVEVAKYYIAQGASINARIRLVGSVLHTACKDTTHGLGMVKLLVENGGDINSDHGNMNITGTPFQSACLRGSASGDESELPERDAIVRYILDHPKFNPSQGSTWWGSNLSVAVFTLGLDIVKELVERGVDTESEDKAGRRAIHLALYRTIPYVDYLLEHKADLYKPDGIGRGPLHIAVLSGRLDLVRYILDKREDLVHHRDVDGWTPLLWVMRASDRWEWREGKDRLAVVEELIKRGASRLIQGEGLDRTWTAYRLARYHGLDDDIVKLVTPTEEELASLDKKERGAWLYSIQNDTKKARSRSGTGAYCDVCMLTPWGLYYDCVPCKVFLLCFKCYRSKQSVHPNHEFVACEQSEYEDTSETPSEHSDNDSDDDSDSTPDGEEREEESGEEEEEKDGDGDEDDEKEEEEEEGEE